MNLLKRIWNDPVGSKVIGGLILALITGLASLIIPSFAECLKSLWQGYHQAIITVVLYTVCLFFYYQVKKHTNVLLFKNLTSLNNICGYDWIWNWKYNDELKKYQIVDIHPLCNTCHQPLILASVYSKVYQCRNKHMVSTKDIEYLQAVGIIISIIQKRYRDERDKMDFSNHRI